MLNQADKALKSKRYKDARNLYKVCLEKGEDSALSYLGISISSYYLREYQNAENYALKALGIRQDLPDAHLILAYTFARTGALLDAEKEINKALVLSPERADILAFAGGVLVGLQKIEEGRAMLYQARKIDPEDWMVYYNLGYAYLVEKNLKASLGEYLKSFRLKKSFSTLARIFIIGLNAYLIPVLIGSISLAFIAFYMRSLVLLLVPTAPLILAGLISVFLWGERKKGLFIILCGVVPLMIFYLQNR